MTHTYTMAAEKRERAGKGIARALRREGKIPSVIYGGNKEPVIIALDGNKSNVEYNKGHMLTSLCDMEIDGKKETVLARDIQVHPVTDCVLHIDFLRVTSKTTLVVKVPVHFMDEDKCPGLRKKGVLNVTRHEVELVCKATDIPDMLEVSLEDIEIGQAVRLSNAKLPEGTKPAIDDRDFTIAQMAAPRIEVSSSDEESEEEGETNEGETSEE